MVSAALVVTTAGCSSAAQLAVNRMRTFGAVNSSYTVHSRGLVKQRVLLGQQALSYVLVRM
jgi:hypothetical protein